MRNFHCPNRLARSLFFVMSTAILFNAIAGCAPQASKDIVEEAVETEWKMPDDSEARAYFATCRDEFGIARKQFDAFEQRHEPYMPQELLNDINAMDITLDGALSKTSLYSNVHPNSAVRDAAQICQQNFVALLGEISLSRPLFNHLVALDTTGLNELDRRFVEKMLRDFRRSGVDKDDATRARIKALIEETNLIGQTFGKNILEDRRLLEVDSVDDLAGMPEDYIAARKDRK